MRQNREIFRTSKIFVSGNVKNLVEEGKQDQDEQVPTSFSKQKSVVFGFEKDESVTFGFEKEDVKVHAHTHLPPFFGILELQFLFSFFMSQFTIFVLICLNSKHKTVVQSVRRGDIEEAEAKAYTC